MASDGATSPNNNQIDSHNAVLVPCLRNMELQKHTNGFVPVS